MGLPGPIIPGNMKQGFLDQYLRRHFGRHQDHPAAAQPSPSRFAQRRDDDRRRGDPHIRRRRPPDSRPRDSHRQSAGRPLGARRRQQSPTTSAGSCSVPLPRLIDLGELRRGRAAARTRHSRPTSWMSPASSARAGFAIPIFLDPNAARDTGLEATGDSGRVQVGLPARLLAPTGASRTAASCVLQSGFRRPDYHGNRFTIGGQVTRVDDVEGGREVNLELWLEQASGERSVRSSAVSSCCPTDRVLTVAQAPLTVIRDIRSVGADVAPNHCASSTDRIDPPEHLQQIARDVDFLHRFGEFAVADPDACRAAREVSGRVVDRRSPSAWSSRDRPQCRR